MKNRDIFKAWSNVVSPLATLASRVMLTTLFMLFFLYHLLLASANRAQQVLSNRVRFTCVAFTASRVANQCFKSVVVLQSQTDKRAFYSMLSVKHFEFKQIISDLMHVLLTNVEQQNSCMNLSLKVTDRTELHTRH